jgi:hypothetical protein
MTQKIAGDGGYRSPYLSHAKRALYHLSYVPNTLLMELKGLGHKQGIYKMCCSR